jgi:hypothetical protein
MTDDANKQCSFCGLKKPEAKVLVEGANGTICGVCAAICQQLVKVNPDKKVIYFGPETGGEAA